MKVKKATLTTAIIAVICGITIFVPSYISASRNPKSLRLDSYDFKSDKARARALKVESKLYDAWNDIKTTYGIDDSDYTVLSTVDDFNNFIQLKIPGFDDQKTVNAIAGYANKIMSREPIGGTIPVLIVKNDLSSFDVCYKLADGSNVRNNGILKNGEWVIKTETKNGKPQMSVK